VHQEALEHFMRARMMAADRAETPGHWIAAADHVFALAGDLHAMASRASIWTAMEPFPQTSMRRIC
jgi:hypothetical protein